MSHNRAPRQASSAFTGSPRRAVIIGALIVTLVVGYLLRDTGGYLVRNRDGSITGDITHYVYWTRLVTLGGIESAYSGRWPETYAVYPPVSLYPYQALGNAYRLTVDPEFDPVRAQESVWLHEGIKFVALSWHVLTGAAIFWLLYRTGTGSVAPIATALYLLDPATLFDITHWAQPDGAHSAFSVLSVGLLSLGQVLLPWAAIALAALAKPQAWTLLPLVAIATLRAHGIVGLARGIAIAALASLIVVSPFLFAGRLAELLALPQVISSVMPVVSADAHNLWWLVLQSRDQDPLFVQDSARLLGPITYRLVAGALVTVVLLLTYWLFWTRRAGLAEAAALGVLGWFTFTTQAHENHLFFALPLLSLAWPTRRWLLVPFAVISVTLLVNMLLHDEMLLEGWGLAVQDPRLDRLRLANATLNVVCCVGWLLAAVLRPHHSIDAASATVSQWRLRVPPHHTRAKVRI